MNWFLWAAVAAAAAGIVLFTALWIDVSRGTHKDDRRGAAGATLLAWCMGGRRDRTRHHRSRRKVLVTPYAKEHTGKRAARHMHPMDIHVGLRIRQRRILLGMNMWTSRCRWPVVSNGPEV